MRVFIGSFLVFLCTAVTVLPAAAQSAWPRFDARWKIEIIKTSGMEPEDTRWVHLHQMNSHVPDMSSAGLSVRILGSSRADQLDPSDANIELRYTVRGIPISGWLSAPFRFTLELSNPALAQVPNGVSDLSVEVRGPGRDEFQPLPGFCHIARGDVADPRVPIITGDDEEDVSQTYGPSVQYVDPADRRWRGYPAPIGVSPWQNPPHSEPGLYLEQLGPHTPLFTPIQMWWDHLAHPGQPYVRGFPPKHGEDHRSLRETHERFPMKDGARGIGWISPYVSGQVNAQGVFYFAEVGGRVGWVKPDGEIVTIAGWRVRPGSDPIWYRKPLEKVRLNMQLRGTFVDGHYPSENGGFRVPLDVAIDPSNDKVFYVAGYEDNCIWKVEVLDSNGDDARVSVFAGALNHAAGWSDGTGTAARFRGPASLVFDPIRDVIYVADQDNDAIRRITRSGAVTTLFGGPGMAGRLTTRGVGDVFDQLAARSASQFEVTAGQAALGLRPDIYVPQTIRVDSAGNLILLELGYGAIRRIHPVSGVTVKLGEVRQKFAQFDRGWAWLDVDRWGSAGPRDGIYWCKFVGTSVDGDNFDRFNEVYAWLPPNGGVSRHLFPESAHYELWGDGWGPREQTNPPHYPWLVAVDPRGAVLLAGGGEHGLVRLRKQRAGDPVPGEFDEQYDRYDQNGQFTWLSGERRGVEASGTSLALKYGLETHNMLGFADGWGLAGASDDDILNAFAIPSAIRSDPGARTNVLYYIRKNIGTSTSTTEFPPSVSAGPDRRIVVRNRARPRAVGIRLRGTASDDGLPASPGALSVRWSVVSGTRRNVVLRTPDTVETNVRFKKPGVYRLRLTADDGQYTSFDEVTIRVGKNRRKRSR